MAETEIPSHEELEEHKKNTFSRGVAMVTALFAVFLAVTSMGGGNATKEMLLAQQLASDQWSYFQAKSIREHMYGMQTKLLEAQTVEKEATATPAVKEAYAKLLGEMKEQSDKYKKEKKEIEQEARRLEHERDLNRAKNPYFEFAEVFLQIAIVMCSFSILSGSRHIFVFATVLALIGVALSANGFFMIVHLPGFGGAH